MVFQCKDSPHSIAENFQWSVITKLELMHGQSFLKILSLKYVGNADFHIRNFLAMYGTKS